jgi:group I intron endonuclease
MYIGSSKNLINRFNRHKNDLKQNKHYNSYLQNSYNKYGIENFEYEILEYCNEEVRVEKEQIWLDSINSYNPLIGYNLSNKASVPIRSLNGNERVRKANLNNKYCLGKKLSQETKDKIGNSGRGRKLSKEHIQKIIDTHTGMKRTDETKIKISNSRRLYDYLVDEWVELRKQGLTYDKISKIYNTSRSNVRRYLSVFFKDRFD